MTDHPPKPPPGSGEPRLCDADMRVLDFLAEHGFDASKVHLLPEADRPRAMALVRQMQVLDRYPSEDCDESLVDATLARVDRWEAANAEAMRLRPAAGSFRLPDFVGIAALVLVGIGVMLPIVSKVRSDGFVRACGDNLRVLHGALGQYASGNDGLLPATASIADFGSIFSARARGAGGKQALTPQAGGRAASAPTPMQFEFRTPTSVTRIRIWIPDWATSNHSSHLVHLSDTGYCGSDALRCPACGSDGPCFAYRVPLRGQRFELDSPGRTVVVADANPLVDAMRRREQVPSRVLPSANHAGSGQNMLFDDGSIEWRTSPVLHDPSTGVADNIWLPRDSFGNERLDLRAWPTHPADNFLAQ